MPVRRDMTDLELCGTLAPAAVDHYRRALDVMSAYPDYAKTQFRIVAEHLVSILGNRYQVALDKMPLYEAINELSANQVIDHSLRSDLHAIRKAGNAVVHSGQQVSAAASTSQPPSTGATGAGDLQSAIAARKTLIGIFESVFLMLNKGEKLPSIAAVEVDDFTSQRTLWKAVTTLDFAAKMAAGLILEAQSMAPLNKSALVMNYQEEAHQTTTAQMATAMYWAACEISAGLDKFGLTEIHLRGGKEACVFELADTEALYRYALLTFDKHHGEDSQRLGLKALETSANRGYAPASASFGDHLRQVGHFEAALKMLDAALSNGDLSAYAGMAILHIGEGCPFYSQGKAEQYLLDGIAKGCHHCEYLLGRWLYGGDDLPLDKPRGLQFLEAAALEGHRGAEIFVEYCVDDRFANALQQTFLNMLPAFTSRTSAPKQNRNEPCQCGSGKKYKKCCGV
ncbi:DUF4145 domain-containing protein [Pseudomonas alliivorans]|nr:DUF4145 domain-containing protein [Pseudomonas alliivorans]MEE5124824.1 DUF4145 domain-containing protein [Pseudomonas alliivorans]MEE5145468.1 DUF4145 domain-containing protein [Pseudomonas alliivorans]MEE5163035.1 DUF4145 domain-containing protein [Pseudomonas alliivorans]